MNIEKKISSAKKSSVITTASVFDKLQYIEDEIDTLLSEKDITNEGINSSCFKVPLLPARDLQLNHEKFFSEKSGLQSKAGQARLLHDLANIELQAVELGLRTLHEFREAPLAFREELARITIEESSHLELCLQGLEDLGHKWGDWPALTTLWDATSPQDSLIDRVLIVHCYLEGSGLDSGEILLNRLGGVDNKKLAAIVGQIVNDEVAHVDFGRRWFQNLCIEAGLDAHDELKSRLWKLSKILPTRGARISHNLREKAGFDSESIAVFEDYQALKIQESRSR